MIRKMTTREIDEVGQIWLTSNIDAHDFIDKDYWKNNLTFVKEQFELANIFVYVENNKIVGFVGLKGDYIAGIFVSKGQRNRGIGKQLLDFLKMKYSRLILEVYAKNYRAKEFYERNEFKVNLEEIDDDNSEKEYQMIWTK